MDFGLSGVQGAKSAAKSHLIRGGGKASSIVLMILLYDVLECDERS